MQIFYRLRGASLAKARLAYYPYPFPEQIAGDGWAAFDELAGDEWAETPATNTSHFRVDYDPHVISHAASHCQFSGINALRIPLDVIATPFLFIDFVVRNIFTERHSSYVAKRRDYAQAMAFAQRSVTRLETEQRGFVMTIRVA